MIAFASSLDQAGPMARSAEDCALLLKPWQALIKWIRPVLIKRFPITQRLINQSIKGLRVGLPKEFFMEGLDADGANSR